MAEQADPRRLGQRESIVSPITNTAILKFAVPAAAVALTVAGFALSVFHGHGLSLLVSGLPLIIAAYMLGVAPKFWRGLDRSLSSKTRWAFQLHAFRTAVVGVAALSFVLMSLEIQGEFFFVVLAFSIPYLFFGIPGTAGLIRVLLKEQPDAGSFRKDGAVVASRLITGVSWVASAIVVFLAVAVFQPWPYSLYEGPDTDWARAGFERTIGFEAPSTVDHLFYRNVSFWQSKELYLKFRYSDPTVANRALESLRIEPTPEAKTYQEIKRHFPSWWLREAPQEGDAVLQYYEDPSVTAVHECVWIDPEKKILYYMFLD